MLRNVEKGPSGPSAVARADAGDRKAPLEPVSLLISIAKSTRQVQTLELKEPNLVAGQDRILLALGSKEPMAVRDLASALTVRASTVSKMVDRLMEKGLTERSAGSGDAREVRVAVTAAGRVAQGVVRRIHARLESKLSIALEGDRSEVGAHLVRLDECLSKRLRRLR